MILFWQILAYLLCRSTTQKRGFSFKVDGPLDLRLNQQKGISAAERLDTIEEKNWQECSMRILTSHTVRNWQKPLRMRSDGDIVWILPQNFGRSLKKRWIFAGKEKKETVKKTCQRVFQALRIDVNQEFEVLYEFMEKLPGALKPGDGLLS